MLVFSEQDLIRDPPFSKLDLISCRNVLIYLGETLQQRVLSVFHYALDPAGLLFLGTSEGLGTAADMFAVLDRKAKLFRRKEGFPGHRRATLRRFLPPIVAPAHRTSHPQSAHEEPRKASLREIAEHALLNALAPTAALVNASGDILYLHGRTGMYLEPESGEVRVTNILKMAREGLRRDLTLSLYRATQKHATVHARGLRVKTNGDFTLVDLSIFPVLAEAYSPSDTRLYMVLLQAVTEPERLTKTSPPEPADDDERAAVKFAETAVEELQRELRAKDEYLQAALGELESSNEGLKSSNEEMQSINEELQSTNEGLQTAKEELQSVNEELVTVNSELQAKVVDLSSINNDMSNLLSGTGIATLFVDHQIRILRFTHTLRKIINLIDRDVGRPIGHIVTNIVGYDSLVEDTRRVLDTLVPSEEEVQTRDGRWYNLRILPYRTSENVIEGAVMTFVEVTNAVEARQKLETANEAGKLAVVARDASDAVMVHDLAGQILAWNPAATRLFGWTEDTALTMNVRDMLPEALRGDELLRVAQFAASRTFAPFQTKRLREDGAELAVSMVATALLNEAGEKYATSTSARALEGAEHA